MITLPDNFRLAQFRFHLEALEAILLPPVPSNALRGGFGHTFKALVCTQPHLCQNYCQRRNSCPYGYIFETAPPEKSEMLSNFSEIPRPFIIRGSHTPRARLGPGENFSFELSLVGAGLNFLPYFIAIFRELGRRGLGLERGRYRLRALEAISPWDRVAKLIYEDEREIVQPVDLTVTPERILARAAALSSNRLTLDFLSPARLKQQGDWVRQGPPFEVLLRTLLGRFSSLSYFHCGQAFEADFRGLVDRAAGVKVAESRTGWEDWARFSGRQKQRIEMGGLLGRVTYEGDLADFLPLLVAGELIHVGKGTVFGNGHYSITGQDLGEGREK